jgi:F0F1-type ATP synthase membrane subunit b/b'
MSSNEKEILYNGTKTKLAIPQSFQEFKELCIQTFYISKQRRENMVFKYYDEDNDEVNINDKSFGKDDCKKSKFWKLSIMEDSSGGSSDAEELEKIKKECISKKSEMLREAKLYKQKLLDECKSIIELKIKEKNKQHQDDLKKAKEGYASALKELKSKIDEQTKNLLEKISERIMNKYLENVKLVDEGVKSQLNEKIDELVNYSKQRFEEINIRSIGLLINQFKYNLEDICKGNGKFYPFLIEDEIIKEIDSPNEKFSFKFNVLNQNAENTKDEFELEITPNDKIKLDLSDVEKGEIKLKSINLDKTLHELDKNSFTLKIINKDTQVSNELKLTFKIKNPEIIGTNEYLFE